MREIEAEELIDMSEEAEQNLRQYLNEFIEKVWPMYQEKGFSLDTAFTVHKLNNLQNLVAAILDDAT